MLQFSDSAVFVAVWVQSLVQTVRGVRGWAHGDDVMRKSEGAPCD